jgi:hypothetical protein
MWATYDTAAEQHGIIRKGVNDVQVELIALEEEMSKNRWNRIGARPYLQR